MYDTLPIWGNTYEFPDQVDPTLSINVINERTTVRMGLFKTLGKEESALIMIPFTRMPIHSDVHSYICMLIRMYAHSHVSSFGQVVLFL
jgi:hypothetical protein